MVGRVKDEMVPLVILSRHARPRTTFMISLVMPIISWIDLGYLDVSIVYPYRHICICCFPTII
jgi:hypothetical protein